MSDADGLCVNLRHPCKRAELPQTSGLAANVQDQWEIPRDSVRKVRCNLHSTECLCWVMKGCCVSFTCTEA